MVAATTAHHLVCLRLDFFRFDPQEAHLGAEVDPVSDVGEEGLRVTGGAGRHTRPVCHHVVMDVLRQDPALFQENSV